MPGREKELLTMDASTFPISLTYHLVFALIAGIFFLVQFIRLRRPYQLLLAIGILASLLIHVGDPHNKVWFNTIGLFELVILVGADRKSTRLNSSHPSSSRMPSSA